MKCCADCDQWDGDEDDVGPCLLREIEVPRHAIACPLFSATPLPIHEETKIPARHGTESDRPCSFCGRSNNDYDVEWIAHGPTASICNNCVSLILEQRGYMCRAIEDRVQAGGVTIDGES